MTSITRRLHWYGIRKKIGRFLWMDLLLLLLLCAGWCADQEYTALRRIDLTNRRSFTISSELTELAEQLSANESSNTLPEQIKNLSDRQGRYLMYQVRSRSGNLLLNRPCLVPLLAILSVTMCLLLLQLLGTVFAYAGEGRAIRKILMPINEIALRADELSRMSFTEDKYQQIEEAIMNIQPEQTQADAPLSFGDSDLAGIETAMNNLLLRMRDTYRQQARFVNDASHELRTPIAVIQGYANMLDRLGKTDEKILEEGISAIKHESDHMNHLVEQLLFLARGDSGKTVLEIKSVSLGDMMREIYEESFMIDEKHHYRLRGGDGEQAVRPVMGGLDEEQAAASGAFEGQAAMSGAVGGSQKQPVMIEADEGLLKQAVRILIDNAAKYTPEGDEIILSSGIDADGCPYLQVQDEGIGMEESELPHIFERFFRSDEVRASAGTGLGLSIAKWIVDKHRGHFEILSRKDLGTRIRIVMPK